MVDEDPRVLGFGLGVWSVGFRVSGSGVQAYSVRRSYSAGC